jgi:clan AA aspartic protease
MTIRGYVDDFYQAIVTVTVRGIRTAVTLDMVLDTAFSGDICLPIPIATQLGLELITTQHYELADGTVEEELVFLGHVVFGEEKPVAIVLTDSNDALLGTGLLTNANLHIDFIAKTVEIEI